MNDNRPDQDHTQESAPAAAETAAETTVRELADIAAQSAKIAGVDVTITPCPEVVINVGSPPRPIRCLGVQFDQEYLLVLLPSSSWRVLKIDPVTRSVVLRLSGWGGFRALVGRILTALIYDRLKARRDQFEPRIAVLRQPEAPLQLTSVPEPPVFPDDGRKPGRSPAVSPGPDAEAPPPALPPVPVPVPAPAPESPARAGSPPPPGPAPPAPPPGPAKPGKPQATTGEKASPLAKRVRR
jgi:hypothetical protein